MDSFAKTLLNISGDPNIIFRPIMEDGQLRRVYSSSGGDTHCFSSLRLAKAYMSRNYTKTFYWQHDAAVIKRLQSQRNTKYTVWAFHVGIDSTNTPWFPPTLVYTHEPK